MSESDGMDDVLENGIRQTLLVAARIAETLARRRQDDLRQREQQDTQMRQEAEARLAAERSAAHAVLAPVSKEDWWRKAQPGDIATAYTVAEEWKRSDPTALAASDRIRQEVRARYGIDTKDLGGDTAYLESGIQTMAREKARRNALDLSQEEARRAEVEHRKAMQLLAAARAEELRAQAQDLGSEMERYQVPAEYLSNPELARALQDAHDAKTPAGAAAADADVKERMFLIDQDGINGPDIQQLKDETTAAVSGTNDTYFEDPEFVKAAKDLHEAKLLAERGGTGADPSVRERYERAEQELFARVEWLGREIESRVAGGDNGRLTDQGLKAESAAAAAYGSAQHYEQFAQSLERTGANESQIRGRMAAARNEGMHPNIAITPGKRAAKARKPSTGVSKSVERGKNGLSR